MKNLVLIFAFLLISASGFSQVFRLSTSTQGQNMETYTVSVPNGGYVYNYGATATNSDVVVMSYHHGYFAMLPNYSNYEQELSGRGEELLGGQTQDTFILIVDNHGGSGTAYISVMLY